MSIRLCAQRFCSFSTFGRFSPLASPQVSLHGFAFDYAQVGGRSQLAVIHLAGHIGVFNADAGQGHNEAQGVLLFG